MPDKPKRSNYKWYVLILTMLAYGSVAGIERLCMPVLFKEISVDLNLSLVSVGTIWGMDPLAGIVVGLVGGLLADRFGVKRTLTVVCILAGIFSAVRGFSINFATMATSMFLFGILAAMTPSIVPKTAAVWFERKQLGLINALINVSWSIGAMAATISSATLLSPWLGGWRNVLFVLGAPAFITGILWLTIGKDPPKAAQATNVPDTPVSIATTAEHVPFRQALSQVIRVKEVWVLGLISLTLWGANMGWFGYVPLYLRNLGWSTAGADGIATAFNGASMAGMIPMILIANRSKNYTGMLFFSMVVTICFMCLTPLVSDAGVWSLVIVSNFLRSSVFAVTNVLLFSLKGVGSTYGGTAVGLVTSIGMIGAFASPPIGNSLAVFGNQMPFYFWGGLAALSLPLFLFLRERKAA